MKHYKIDLNSENNGTPYDFTNIFSPPLNLGLNPEVALSSLRIWNSLRNISLLSNNNALKYFNGTIWRILDIPDGTYSIEALNSVIQAGLSANGDLSTNINIIGNYQTLKVEIYLNGGYQVDLTYNKLYELLGYTPIVVSAVFSQGEFPANVNLGVNSWVINTNIIAGDSSYNNGASSSSLYSFSPNVPAGSLIDLNPSNLLYLPLASSNISRLNIRITDQLGNLLTNLGVGEQTSFTLVIRTD
jgi:hypothetical protein